LFGFRTEAFDFFNQAGYAYPRSSLRSSSTFGVVAAATTFPARILQCAGTIVF
jgi:hypothetical protein